MKHAIWLVAVAAVLLGAAAKVTAQEGEGDIPTPEQMGRMQMAMELEAHKAKLDHEREMRQLDIEARRAEIDRQRNPHGHHDGGCGAIVLLIIITHIVLTVWVFRDMREQKIGRALWVPIVLLTGVMGAILYAIVRVADTRGKAAG